MTDEKIRRLGSESNGPGGAIEGQEPPRREEHLVHAIAGLATDLDLQQVLQRIVSAACWLVDARFAALGVLGDDGTLVEFVHEGMDDAHVKAIGRLPEMHGVLGALIDGGRPVRVDDVAGHPRAAGFPEHHPRVRTLLGTPIVVRDEVFGNLYVGDKRAGGEFTDHDERLLVALAAAAGSAVANARLLAETTRRERSLAALRDVATVLLAGSDPESALQVIATQAAEILDADMASIAVPSPEDPHQLVVRAAIGDRADELHGCLISIDHSIAGEVARTGKSYSLTGTPPGEEVREPPDEAAQASAAVYVPLWLHGQPSGTLAIGRRKGRPRFARDEVQLLESFAAQASIALEYAAAQTSRQRIAVLEDQDRIARDLHDSVIQDLFAIGMQLQATVRLAHDPLVGGRIQRAVDDLDETIRTIRTVIFGLANAASSEGLRNDAMAMVADLASSYGLLQKIEFEGAVDALVPDDIGEHLLSTLHEAMSNAGRHAQANRVDVAIKVIEREVVLRVSDDGIGMPRDLDHCSGLRNIEKRAHGLGGRLRIDSRPSEGTTIDWRVPLPDVER